jgi:hypothetical protein
MLVFSPKDWEFSAQGNALGSVLSACHVSLHCYPGRRAFGPCLKFTHKFL